MAEGAQTRIAKCLEEFLEISKNTGNAAEQYFDVVKDINEMTKELEALREENHDLKSMVRGIEYYEDKHDQVIKFLVKDVQSLKKEVFNLKCTLGQVEETLLEEEDDKR